VRGAMPAKVAKIEVAVLAPSLDPGGEASRVVPGDEAAQANLLDGINFVFRPVWDPTRNAIATYLCVPQVKISDIDSAVGDASLVVKDDLDGMARLDSATIAHVKEDLQQMAVDGRRLIIATPVHFETLCSASERRKYAAELETIPEPMKQYLVSEVVRVPAGVPKRRLIDVIAPLRLHCRAVWLQVAIETNSFTEIRGAGIAGVGADIATLMKSEFVAMHHLIGFQRAAEKVGVATFLHGAQSRSLVAAAVGAGFHYIDGDGVVPARARPDGMVAFSLADLFQPQQAN
jgi:hypothetical protein